jgi:UDP-galactopyranose mutase
MEPAFHIIEDIDGWYEDARVTDVAAFRKVVVGSGFFGAVMAERIATVLQEPVLVLERRPHLGGNSVSEQDPQTGIEYHRYGSHLFHTSNAEVWEWINRFSAFTNYRHRVFSRVDRRTYTMPINLMTLNNFFSVDLTPDAAQSFLTAEAAKEPYPNPENLEQKAISLIGRRLYEAFIEGYTAKQWETDPKLLPPDIITRLPVRFSFNDFYFNDLYEGLPVDGYGSIFQRIFANPLITTLSGCDYFDLRTQLRPDAIVIYTGPIDRYFGFDCGRLSWRTLDFEIERPMVDDYQGAAVVNYPERHVPFTRVHEFKHLHPERRYPKGRTLIMREFSRFATGDDEPYYPVNTQADKKLYDIYAERAAAEPRVIFGGRLGTYRYLDMHQAIGAALRTFERVLLPLARGQHETKRRVA